MFKSLCVTKKRGVKEFCQMYYRSLMFNKAHFLRYRHLAPYVEVDSTFYYDLFMFCLLSM